MTISQGVFLDLGSLDDGDLDARSLDHTLPGWQWYAFTAPAKVSERIRNADVVVTNKCVLDRSTLTLARQLKLVAIAATGTNVVDLDAARDLGIRVCNVRDYATHSVAQHVITLILNLATAQPFYFRRVLAGDWSAAEQFSLHDHGIREIQGLQLGIVGHGILGRAVAQLARRLGMNVLVAEHQGRRVRPDRLKFEDVIAVADVISLHCPLNAETQDLFDRQLIRTMKRSAFLINTARGGIVVEQDLADALRSGDIAGAGVDTLSVEPPPPDHPLLMPDIPNLILTPHNAWASKPARQVCIDQIAEVINAFKHGQPINTVV